MNEVLASHRASWSLDKSVTFYNMARSSDTMKYPFFHPYESNPLQGFYCVQFGTESDNIFSAHFSTSKRQAHGKIKYVQGWRSGDMENKKDTGTQCVCSHEHSLQCDKPGKSFRDFKSKLNNRSPRPSGADYQPLIASQSNF